MVTKVTFEKLLLLKPRHLRLVGCMHLWSDVFCWEFLISNQWLSLNHLNIPVCFVSYLTRWSSFLTWRIHKIFKNLNFKMLKILKHFWIQMGEQHLHLKFSNIHPPTKEVDPMIHEPQSSKARSLTRVCVTRNCTLWSTYWINHSKWIRPFTWDVIKFYSNENWATRELAPRELFWLKINL